MNFNEFYDLYILPKIKFPRLKPLSRGKTIKYLKKRFGDSIIIDEKHKNKYDKGVKFWLKMNVNNTNAQGK